MAWRPGRAKLRVASLAANVTSIVQPVWTETFVGERDSYSFLEQSPSLVFRHDSGHVYEMFRETLPYTAWLSRAAELVRDGMQGHLATIESETEWKALQRAFAYRGLPKYWLGGSDRSSEGRWVWDTGPYVGTQFWSGVASGAAVGELGSKWKSGEPNNYDGGEDCMHISSVDVGLWNDDKCSKLYSALVEYEPETTTTTTTTTITSTTTTTTTTMLQGGAECFANLLSHGAGGACMSGDCRVRCCDFSTTISTCWCSANENEIVCSSGEIYHCAEDEECSGIANVAYSNRSSGCRPKACYTNRDRTRCCSARDGRAEFSAAPNCVWNPEGFSSSNKCEPAKWVQDKREETVESCSGRALIRTRNQYMYPRCDPCPRALSRNACLERS